VFGDCWLTRAADWGGDNGGWEDSISMLLAPSFVSLLFSSSVIFSSSKNDCGAIGPRYIFLRLTFPLANLNQLW
jgi:hypothetical protein